VSNSSDRGENEIRTLSVSMQKTLVCTEVYDRKFALYRSR